jgi:hypothetical protein
LALSPNFCFELRDQSQYAHHQLARPATSVDSSIVQDFEGNTPVGQVRHYSVEVRRGAGQTIQLGHKQSVALAQVSEAFRERGSIAVET